MAFERRHMLCRRYDTFCSCIQTRGRTHGPLPDLCEHVHLGFAHFVRCLRHTHQNGKCGGHGFAGGRDVPDGKMSMGKSAYEPTDRRPIASRERRVGPRIAGILAGRQVSPNSISIMGMLVGVIAGILLAGTRFVTDAGAQRALWLMAAAGIQLRLLANMLDGMVAIETHKASRLGELYNELPDRVSDVVIIVGAGYAFSSLPVLGYVAACLAILTAYVRAV